MAIPAPKTQREKNIRIRKLRALQKHIKKEVSYLSKCLAAFEGDGYHSWEDVIRKSGGPLSKGMEQLAFAFERLDQDIADNVKVKVKP